MLSICWANSLVGVIMSPNSADGNFSNLLFEYKSNIYDKIGKANANVLPEPVCEAIKKS